MLLLDRFIKIYRLDIVSGNKTAYLTFTTSIESTVQPLGKGGVFGGGSEKMFTIYLDVDKDVKEGDQIRDYDGNIYEVVSGGINNRTDGYIADYMSVSVRKIYP